MKKEFVCIVCPRGCSLSIDLETLEVTGNTCKRGYDYAVSELTHPTRMITSTCKVASSIHLLCPKFRPH